MLVGLDYWPAATHAPGIGRYVRELVRALARRPEAPELRLGSLRRVDDRGLAADPRAAMKDAVPPPFHLAFPVHDLAAAREFYGGLLGCPEGRSSESWVDFDFRGHQIVAHLVPGAGDRSATDVDGDAVPVPHFGAVLPWAEWHALADRLREAGVRFVIEPRVRFRGALGEQATMFLRDPSGNALEFKAFEDPSQLFARG